MLFLGSAMHLPGTALWIVCLISFSASVSVGQDKQSPSLNDAQEILDGIKQERLSVGVKNKLNDTMKALAKIKIEHDPDMSTVTAAMPSSPSLSLGTIIADPARIRTEPNTGAPITEVLHKGQVVEIIELKNEWYRVITKDDITGYIFSEFLKPHRQLTRKEIMRVNTALELRDVANEMSDAVASEREEFKTSAFKCREELERCRPRFGFIDCELTMIVCLANVLTGD